jgi:pyruvate/2-oxoglutarate/acetoin dehydrogenase E1 component
MLVIVEQSPKGLSIVSRMAEYCQAAFFGCLGGPVIVLSGLEIPPPVLKRQGQVAVPSLDEIQQTIFKTAKRQL